MQIGLFVGGGILLLVCVILIAIYQIQRKNQVEYSSYQYSDGSKYTAGSKDTAGRNYSKRSLNSKNSDISADAEESTTYDPKLSADTDSTYSYDIY